MVSCSRSKSSRSSRPSSEGSSSLLSARYSCVIRRLLSGVIVITSQRSTPIIFPTSVTVACRKWSRFMTEKVSEPMRLRIASRASCILSLRSTDRGSLISLPCDCQGQAFAAVGITYLDFDRSARWKNIAGYFREERRAVVAPWLSMVGHTADNYRDVRLHVRAVYDQLAILCFVAVLGEDWLTNGYLCR